MSSSIIALEQFARLADRRLDDVMENYLKPYQEMIGTIFGMMPLDKAFAELYDVGQVPDIPVFTGKLDYLGVSPGYFTQIEPKEYAAGIQLQRKFKDDKQYSVFDDLQAGMMRSYGRVKEKAAANVFNRAFASTWDYMKNEEGVALCSTAHTTKSGASTSTGFSNAGTSALSKTSIMATAILFRKFRDDIGEYFDSEPDTIVVPESLYYTACEAVGYDPKTGASSDRDPDTAHYGKINAVYKGFKVIAWRRLDDTSTKNWFMLDSQLTKKFVKWIDRIKPESNTKIDFETFAVKQSIYGRFGTGWRNWRSCYGHSVT